MNLRIATAISRLVQLKNQLQQNKKNSLDNLKNAPVLSHLAAFKRRVSIEQGRLNWPALGRQLKSLVPPYLGLLVLAFFVLIGNHANRQAQAAETTPLWQSPVAELSAETVEKVLSAVNPLTPEVAENPERIASLLLSDEDLYLRRPGLAQMAEAETLSKKDPIPYVVAQGDTMISIAKAHGRTVATILEANNIKPDEAWQLKPGTSLLIPQEDTSFSLAWLEAENKARQELEAKRQAAIAAAAKTKAKNRALAQTTTRERASGGFDDEGGGVNFIVPIRHNGITRGLSRGHAGIDYRADMGTAVVAAARGRVIEITRGWAGGFGNSVLIDHGGGWTSRYAHLSESATQIGATVDQGTLVGYSGNTGHSTGPHLHFEVRAGGRAVNPF